MLDILGVFNNKPNQSPFEDSCAKCAVHRVTKSLHFF